MEYFFSGFCCKHFKRASAGYILCEMACSSSYKIRGKLRGLQDTWLSNILTRLACIFLEHSNTCTEWLRWHFPLNFIVLFLIFKEVIPLFLGKRIELLDNAFN